MPASEKIARRLNQDRTGSLFTSKNVYDRYNRLRGDPDHFSGFEWDDVHSLVTASDYAWEHVSFLYRRRRILSTSIGVRKTNETRALT